ncbi:MAG: HAMP domain-containing histidine kinase [Chloroflexi bacterium]|nr:HAMP domain-containing histidine kinase [Chloroflexota bacterium]
MRLCTSLDKTLARLETITERLLLLTRNERQIVREDVYLWPLLEDVLLDMEDLAASKGVTMHLAGDTELAILGDSALLAIIFRNLIENAIYYNRQGGLVQIHLDQDRQDNTAVISIADTGIGIPPEEQPFVFSRFYRGRQARTYHPNGTGLGLPLVVHLVQLHGGTLHLTSTPDQGSIFTIRLPL